MIYPPEYRQHVIRLAKASLTAERNARPSIDRPKRRKIVKGYRVNARHELAVSDFLSEVFAKGMK